MSTTFSTHDAPLGDVIETCRAFMADTARYLKNCDVVERAVALMDLATIDAAPEGFDPAWPLMFAAASPASSPRPGKLTVSLNVIWTEDGRVLVAFRDGDPRAFAMLCSLAAQNRWTEMIDYEIDEADLREGRFVSIDSAVFDARTPSIITGAESEDDRIEQTLLPVPTQLERLRTLVEATSLDSPLVTDALWAAAGTRDELWVATAQKMYPIRVEDLYPEADISEGTATHFVNRDDLEALRRRAFAVLRQVRPGAEGDES